MSRLARVKCITSREIDLLDICDDSAILFLDLM